MTLGGIVLKSAFCRSQICGESNTFCAFCVRLPLPLPNTSFTQQHKHKSTMSSYHPDGLTVDIVGIIASDRERNCDKYPFCGEIVQLGVVVCFRREMILVGGGTNGGPGREEPTIIVYWATDGIDACRIRFLPWHMNHHASCYDGVLGQITDTFSAGHHNHAIHEKWHRNM